MGKELPDSGGDAGKKASRCFLHRDRSRKSFEDIARELNIESLQVMVVVQLNDKVRVPLLTALVRLAGLIETTAANGMRYLHSPLCCVPPVLTCADDILHAARVMAPLPFTVSGENSLRMLRFLQDDKRVLILPAAAAGQNNIFWNITTALSQDTDADIKGLWHASKKDNTKALEAELLAAGLTPMRMRPAPIIIIADAKAQPAPKRPKTTATTRRQKNIARLISKKCD